MGHRFPCGRGVFASFCLAGLLAAGGVHADVEDVKPVTFGAVVTAETLDNLQGGRDQGAWGEANLDLTAAWKGSANWEAYGYILVDAHGGFSGRYSGDTQTVSNIDTVPGTRLFEAWARHTSTGEHFVTTLGVVNLNGIFDTQPTGGVFLNASNGIGPDYSQSGPSIFPFSGLGVVEEWRITDGLRWRSGVFDGVPGDPGHRTVFVSLMLHKAEGLHLVTEVEGDFKDGFVKLGAWRDTAAADRLDGGGAGHKAGAYAQLGLTLTHEHDDAAQGLSGWVRLGTASQAVLNLSGYAGGGLVYTGLLPHRDHDLLGLSLARAAFGDPYRLLNPGQRAAETTLEATYQYEVKAGTTLQPDLQWIRHPSGAPDVKDALVIGVRFRHDLLS